MTQSWCKVASNLDSHPKIRRAGRNGREVFLFALRRNAESRVSGIIPGLEMEPWFIADQLMITEGEAAEGLQRAISAGLLEIQDGAIAIVGWEAQWGRRELTHDDRAKGGAVRASNAKRGPNGAFYPGGDQVSPGETPAVSWPPGPAANPPGPAGQLRSEERRREEKRVEIPECSPPARPEKPRGCPLPDAWLPTDTPAMGKTIAKAVARGIDIEAEIQNMRDWSVSKGEVSKDWNARFRLWLNRANGQQSWNAATRAHTGTPDRAQRYKST